MKLQRWLVSELPVSVQCAGLMTLWMCQLFSIIAINSKAISNAIFGRQFEDEGLVYSFVGLDAVRDFFSRAAVSCATATICTFRTDSRQYLSADCWHYDYQHRFHLLLRSYNSAEPICRNSRVAVFLQGIAASRENS